MGDQMIGKIERESSRRGKLMYSWSRAPSGCWAGGKEKKVVKTTCEVQTAMGKCGCWSSSGGAAFQRSQNQKRWEGSRAALHALGGDRRKQARARIISAAHRSTLPPPLVLAKPVTAGPTPCRTLLYSRPHPSPFPSSSYPHRRWTNPTFPLPPPPPASPLPHHLPRTILKNSLMGQRKRRWPVYYLARKKMNVVH